MRGRVQSRPVCYTADITTNRADWSGSNRQTSHYPEASDGYIASSHQAGGSHLPQPLEREYGDRLAFAPIRVIPDIDQWGDEYLRIESSWTASGIWINACTAGLELLEYGGFGPADVRAHNRVIPDIDQWGDEYLRVEVVLDGDRSAIGPAVD